MNPRASAAATRSMRWLRKGSASARMASWNAAGAAKSGVISRNRIPGLGKSGISRMYAARFTGILPWYGCSDLGTAL